MYKQIEKLLTSVSIAPKKTDNSVEIDGTHYHLTSDVDHKPLVDFMIEKSKQHPTFSPSNQSFSEIDLSAPFTVSSHVKRSKLLYLLTLLVDKSGKKIYGLTTKAGKTAIKMVNNCKIENMSFGDVKPVKVEEPKKESVKTEKEDEPKKEESVKPKVKQPIKKSK